MSRMAPASTPRQLWVWSLPSLVILLSLVWYKRKRNTLRSDPGGTSKLLPDSAESECQEEEARSTPSFLRSESTYEPDSTIGHLDPTETSSVGDLVEPVVAVPSEELACSVDTSSTCTSVVVNSEAVCLSAAEEIEECKREVVLQCETVCEPEGKSTEVVEEEVDSNDLEEAVHQEAECKESVSTVAQEGAVSSSGSMKDAKEVESTMAPSQAKQGSQASQDGKDESDKVAVLEDKLKSLALGTTEEQRRGVERDSANHSPVDAMLASPSMSSYSDEHSEGSSDSGKGCSDVASPPSRTPVGSGSLAGDADGVESTSTYSVYDFLLPQLLVGRLIGRHGSFVHEIKSKTNATIWIKRHPETTKHKLCSVEGTSADIDSALAMIRQRFPPSKYPNVSLEQISLAPAPTTFPLVPDFCQLHLVEGVNNEVMISSLVSPAHMFVQQPYHPSYQFLQRLNHMMNSVYANVETPNLPDPIEAGNICVAPAIDGWYRAQVVSTNEETQTSEIKFVDYGGYMSVSNSVLRQIRQDFMTLPFQATECYLANIKPSGESGEWSLDALQIVEELTRRQMLLAQVYDYAADGVPLIYLYSSVNSQVVLINQELVARGMADLDDSVVSSPTSEAASLVVAAKAVAVAAAHESASTAASSTTDSEEKAVAEPSCSSEVAAN